MQTISGQENSAQPQSNIPGHPIEPDIIDLKTLNILEDRFRKQHQQRRSEIFKQFTTNQRIAMQVLPLLIHSGHAALPGYVSHAPTGIDNYEPDDLTLANIKKITMSFTQPRLIQPTTNIQSLFIMSCEAPDHNSISSVKLWVCCKKNTHALLEKKMHLIYIWAKEYQLELGFFLLDPNDFKLENKIPGVQTPRLLLDEFYRSATLLEGRFPIWWLVPGGPNVNYSSYVARLLKQRFVQEEQITDFGRVTSVPQEECYLAGLIEMERSFETPHKSLLELMLIESYATNQSLSSLSEDYKIAMHSAEIKLESLDNYLLLYHRVEAHFSERNDSLRQNTLRECFVSKLAVNGPPLNKDMSEVLENLYTEWNWDKHTVDHLQHKRNWSIHAYIEEDKKISSALNLAYCWIEELAKKTPLRSEPALLNQTEARRSILKSKLLSTEPSKQNAIARINPVLLPKQSTEQLIFRRRQQTWQILSDLQKVFESERLSETVIWCLQNGLSYENVIYEDTASGEPQHEYRIERIFACLKHHIHPQRISNKDDQGANHLIVLINAEEESMHDLSQQGSTIISNWNDPLCFSGFQYNLVSSIEIITIDKSHQITTQVFFGDTALVSLLEHVQNNSYEKQNCYCIDNTKTEILRNRLQKLLNKTSPQSLAKQGIARYIFSLGSSYICLDTAHDHAPMYKISTYSSETTLFSHLATTPKKISSAGNTLTRVDSKCGKLARFAAFCNTIQKPLPVIMVDESQGTVSLYAGTTDGAIYHTGTYQRPAKQLAHSLSTFAINLTKNKVKAPRIWINQGAGPSLFRPPQTQLRQGLSVKKYTALTNVYDFSWGDTEWLHVMPNNKLIDDIAQFAADYRAQNQVDKQVDPHPIYISEVHIDQPQNNFMPYFRLKLHLEALFANHLDY
ncbi:MAG: class I adenylate cyclase [Pseudomonadales bacterium]|nr:class I adenylate cyclase [Pseudomonadales bacterium]